MQDITRSERLNHDDCEKIEEFRSRVVVKALGMARIAYSENVIAKCAVSEFVINVWCVYINVNVFFWF